MAIFNHNFSSFWEQPVPSKKQQPKPYLRRRELKIYYYRKIYFSPHRRKRVSHILINPNFCKVHLLFILPNFGLLTKLDNIFVTSLWSIIFLPKSNLFWFSRSRCYFLQKFLLNKKIPPHQAQRWYYSLFSPRKKYPILFLMISKKNWPYTVQIVCFLPRQQKSN